MKGYTVAVPLGKRRWRGPAAAVFVLIFFSLVFPPAFLIGINKRFPSVFLIEDSLQLETSFFSNGRADSIQESFEGTHKRIGEVVRKFEASSEKKLISKNAMRLTDSHGNTEEVPCSQQKGNNFLCYQKDTASMPLQFHRQSTDSLLKLKESSLHSKASPTPEMSKVKLSPPVNAKNNGGEIKRTRPGIPTLNGSCLLEFGSYCLWSVEHKEIIKDSIVRRLKDQLFVARSYYPSIAKLKAQEKLSSKLKQNIQEHERMLSDAISNPDLPIIAMEKMKRMDEVIDKAKLCAVDCGNIERKLRQILDQTEEEVHFHMKQSAFLYNLGVQTVPKSLHCFFMRLTMEYFTSPTEDECSLASKIGNPDLNHYVVFSTNVLAASVTVNSTVMNSKETEKMVFHLVTDQQNYYTMKAWFMRNSFGKVAIHVLNIDEVYKITPCALSRLSLSEEFRVSIMASQMETAYLSVFGHTHFLLPEIFNNLKRVVVLEDDVVVQQDLSFLWDLDMEGKVLGAVVHCNVRLYHLKSYLYDDKYDPDSCAWTSGLNVVDLEKWRERNVTAIYHNVLLKVKDMGEASWRSATLPASLLSFQDLVYPLDTSWILSGLGHEYGIGIDAMNAAAALHYDGKMKPWLELGVPKYKSRWRRFLKEGDSFMGDCNFYP